MTDKDADKSKRLVLIHPDELHDTIRKAVQACLNEQDNRDPLLDVRGIAEFLKVNPRTIPKLVSRDKLPEHLVGERYRAYLSDLERWVRARPSKRRDLRRRS